MRTLYGRTSMNEESRFVQEIPNELIERVGEEKRMQKLVHKQITPFQQTGGEEFDWNVGDKVVHKKWGVGTVVSIRGSGDSLELDIAFPSPVGIKRLLAQFAPIQKA